MSLLDLTIQATVSMIVLVDPFTRGVFFRILTENEPEQRPRLVAKLMVAITIILGGAALVGKPLLDLVGINLGAFGIAGGIVLTLMGFEMLLGGEASRVQGGQEAHEAPAPMSADDSIIIPYAMPFMAGPGAISTVIAFSSSGEGWNGTIAALIAVAVVVALIPVGHLLLVNRMNFSERMMSIIARIGGLIVATIGVQLILSGIRTFYEF